MFVDNRIPPAQSPVGAACCKEWRSHMPPHGAQRLHCLICYKHAAPTGLGICEEKGSGVDKVVKVVEMFQLPAPDFRVGELRTTAVLFAHRDFGGDEQARPYPGLLPALLPDVRKQPADVEPVVAGAFRSADIKGSNCFPSNRFGQGGRIDQNR